MPNYTEVDFNRQVNYLNQTKNLMREAIINKGQEVDINTPFRDYADRISNIGGNSVQTRGVSSSSSNILHFKNISQVKTYINANDGDMAFVYDGDNSYFDGIFKASISTTQYHAFSFINNIRLDTSNATPKVQYDEANDNISVQDMDTLKNILITKGGLTEQQIKADRIRTIEKLDNNNFNIYHFYYHWETDYITISGLIEDKKLIIESTFNKYNYDSLYFFENDNKIHPWISLYGSNPVVTSEDREGNKETITTNTWMEICNNIDINIVKNLSGFHAYKYHVNILNNTCEVTEYNNFVNLIRYEGDNELNVYLSDWDFMNKELTMVWLFDYSTGPEVAISLAGYVYESKKDFKKYTNVFDFASVPFTAEAVSVTNGYFYGANGVEKGEMFDNKSYDTQEDILKLPKRLNIYFSGEKVNTSSLTNCYNYFSNLPTLKEAPVLNTSLVTNMANMFYLDYNLINVPLYNTSLVTNMYYMFYYCYNLKTIPNYNTVNVTSMASMFYGCSNLITIPNFDTSNVTNMASMFGGINWLDKTGMLHICENLTHVPNFNTINVTTMASMFYECKNLTTVPNFNTSKVTTMLSFTSRLYKVTKYT